ncbi:hypothetical protein GNI_010730 [Gregarina niphandrodes]|uniref:Uncharacterized protein n=1 Tax=Gregarina niphandrodes TaxID=110365 RepID=A0A023BCZ4_GRENI|nr:hypothetical protein GNI_010730 [Gregarina niphandrodes]EZG86211.1 hypothetical protein GNI_010730 [Gregarina niphandrodes]|eukprot:XP_011128779.1 hypothetical protein GNI_010730 [Gregarina niphandrodes]
MPLCENGERLLVVREKTALKMIVNGKTYSGKGVSFLTSRRIVFLKHGDVSKHKNWSSCEFPFNKIYNKTGDLPEFNQPIFGSNNLTWSCSPNPAAQQYKYESTAEVQLDFKNSCYTFVKLFLVLMDSAKKHGGDATAETGKILDGVRAYIDQGDPTRIFFTQPGKPPSIAHAFIFSTTTAARSTRFPT